jgi:hypothetical protein
MGFAADDEDMNGLLITLILLVAFVGVGLLAVFFGTDSRAVNPRDVRASWH